MKKEHVPDLRDGVSRVELDGGDHDETGEEKVAERTAGQRDISDSGRVGWSE